MKIKFTKMEGAGNDFVLINALEVPFDLTQEQIQKICHRRFGIGADQLLVVLPSNEADFRMDIYNADGANVEMCGNGIRCFLKYLRDQGEASDSLDVETLAGIIRPEIVPHVGSNTKSVWVKVDMGKPILDGQEIPANHDGLIVNYALDLSPIERELKNHSLPPDFSSPIKITAISMGNPHCILYVKNVDQAPVEIIGPYIGDHPFFPNRTNVEFIQVVDRKTLRMRVWERGAGETLACGTGACAATVASIMNNYTGRKVLVQLKGGNLEIEWDEISDHVFMTGPATTVFEGTIEV